MEITNNSEDFTLTCADCGASDPGWASLNHCVLICSECCFVHRNLGRHISQIRSLTGGIWHTNQLKLINYLYKNGSNNIWEHSLIDSHSGRVKKKPVSNDPIIPKKEAFINDKYVRLLYAIRPAKDEFTVDDLNKQLWSSVRTGHVITALRLLALGASPDFVDQGNTPLHIAAKNGQDLQVELLWIYGADFSCKNSCGQTPAEVAKKEGHLELSERIIKLSFEVSDHFSLFLCGRKPSHKDNQHFLIPDLVDPFISERMHNLGKQVHLISDLLFERLVQDVYDEVDRREIELQWSALNNSQIRMHKHVAIFLPPNPQLSATRNQMRQKLAKFSSSDFFYLVIDLLKEIRRRYFGIQIPVEDVKNNEISFLSDEQLDGVYSDNRGKLCLSESSNENRSQNHKTLHSEQEQHFYSLDNYLELKEKLRDTNEKLERMEMSNSEILGTLKQMQRALERLEYDQTNIRQEMNEKLLKQYNQYRSTSPSQGQQTSTKTPPLQNSLSVSLNNATAQIGAVMMSASTLMRPNQQQQKYVHNYSTDTYPSTKISGRHSSTNNTTNNLIPAAIPSIPLHSAHSSSSMKIQNNLLGHEERLNSFAGSSKNDGGTNSFNNNEKKHSLGSNNINNISNETRSYRKNSSHSISHLKIVQQKDIEHSTTTTRNETNEQLINTTNKQGNDMNKIFNEEVFPDNLILETELLTSAIKALLADLQPNIEINSRETNAMYHADTINHHIIRILNVIPDSYIRIESIQQCAFKMEAAMKQLSKKCISRPLNIDEACQAAYDVAKAAKELLVIVHKQAEKNVEI
uniref:Arf-GAP domain-containing protein n=1 Tax=Meloidogyne incognita TaxID=6306 RepID=A0A914L4K6_MELIC